VAATLIRQGSLRVAGLVQLILEDPAHLADRCRRVDRRYFRRAALLYREGQRHGAGEEKDDGERSGSLEQGNAQAEKGEAQDQRGRAVEQGVRQGFQPLGEPSEGGEVGDDLLLMRIVCNSVDPCSTPCSPRHA